MPCSLHLKLGHVNGTDVLRTRLILRSSSVQVILFIHGMDSRLEEADDLTAALHRLDRLPLWSRTSSKRMMRVSWILIPG